MNCFCFSCADHDGRCTTVQDGALGDRGDRLLAHIDGVHRHGPVVLLRHRVPIQLPEMPLRVDAAKRQLSRGLAALIGSQPQPKHVLLQAALLNHVVKDRLHPDHRQRRLRQALPTPPSVLGASSCPQMEEGLDVGGSA